VNFLISAQNGQVGKIVVKLCMYPQLLLYFIIFRPFYELP